MSRRRHPLQRNLGQVDTPFIRADKPHSRTSSADPDVYARRLELTPVGRLVTAQDVAATDLLLCSAEAAMIPVDGGSVLL